MELHMLLYSIILAIFSTSLIGITFGSEFGHECDETDPCSSTANLKCENSVCACAEPSSMRYNRTRRKCVTVKRKENKCSHGFSRYEDKTCGPVHKSQAYAQRCNSSHHCNASAVLTCNDHVAPVDGYCVCAEEELMVHDERSGVCLSLADPKSSCYFEPMGGVRRKCTAYANCIPTKDDPTWNFGFCKCSGWTEQYEDKTCGLAVTVNEIGGKCNSSHTCNEKSFLQCTESEKDPDERVCTCVPNSHLVYEAKTKSCISLVGFGNDSACYLHPIDGLVRGCTEHAGCLPRPGSGDYEIGYCACLFGFVEYGDRTCGLPRLNQRYGQPCNATWACDTTALLSCNPNTGKCACKYEGDVVDEWKQKCTSPSGGFCHLVPVDNQLRVCTKDAACIQEEDSTGPFGSCDCDEGFAATVTGECESILDSPTTLKAESKPSASNHLLSSTEVLVMIQLIIIFITRNL